MLLSCREQRTTENVVLNGTILMSGPCTSQRLHTTKVFSDRTCAVCNDGDCLFADCCFHHNCRMMFWDQGFVQMGSRRSVS